MANRLQGSYRFIEKPRQGSPRGVRRGLQVVKRQEAEARNSATSADKRREYRRTNRP